MKSLNKSQISYLLILLLFSIGLTKSYAQIKIEKKATIASQVPIEAIRNVLKENDAIVP